MIWATYGSEARRKRLYARLPESPLKRYLAAPLPARSSDYRDCAFLALDFETTGLDPRRDSILSIGFVPLENGSILLAGAAQLLVRPEREVAASALVHGITDDDAATGLELADALPRLLDALRGRVLLAHHAALEQRFLAAACSRLYGVRPPLVAVDTLRLQARLERRGFQQPREDGLRLQAARARFNLPRYRAHGALADALACAELFLAQAAELAGDGKLPLARLTR